jgi:hypothetical protein
MSVLFGLVLAFLVVLIGSALVLFVKGPDLLMQPRRRTVAFYRRTTSLLHPRDLHIPYEELELHTAEGINLSGWFLPAPSSPPKGTIIYLHGVSECKIVGLPLAQRLHNAGYHVLLYDARCHGDSGGTYCTYGFYEKHDTGTIISYLQGKSDIVTGRIGLFGSSMGAAVAIQVAARDKRVSCVIAESGFATLRTIFDDYQKRMVKLPWHYLRNLVISRSEQIAHFKASSVSPLDSVRDIHIPLFILHGTKDKLIKFSYSQQLYESANHPKTLWLIPGADHNNMAEVGGEEYYGRILTFLDDALTGGDSQMRQQRVAGS